MSFKVVEQYYTLPFSVAVQRSHMRFTLINEDANIERYIAAAVEYAENRMWRKITAGRIVAVFDSFPPENEPLEIPRPPLYELINVSARTKGGAYTIIASDQYTLDDISEPARILPVSSWPNADGLNGVRLEYKAGYELITQIPAQIVQGLQMMTAHFFENRESVIVREGSVTVKEVPDSANRLFDMYSLRLV
jgi:uncharacterized phiE125 gp8 family phage protein